MKVSAKKAAEHRARILQEAARLFRDRGFENVSVADIMRHAGLTHGGFYGHFTSKEALFAEVCETTLQASTARLAAVRDGSPELDGYIKSYLSEAHLLDAGNGCPIAALAVEVSRMGPSVKAAFARGLSRYLMMASSSSPDKSGDDVRYDDRITTIAGMVGALVMARSIQEIDAELAQKILAATRRSLCARNKETT